ncbi:MAG: PepSY domain-containing protein [Oscillospiraceae bacterium]|nr:PepSY domain-containing protein [Oscillospiraceae bacterium]
MKKLTVLLTLVLLLLGFAGCQSANNHLQTPPATDAPAGQPAPDTTAAAPISQEAAIQIALEHAQLKAEEVTRLHAEYDRDEGAKHYDVDFEKDGFEYSYEIDAYTGKILDADKGWDD